MPALFSVVVLLPGNTAASFGRLLRSVPETRVCLAGEHRHPWGWLAAEIRARNSHLPSFTLMGFGWLLRFVPGTRTCLYLLFSLPFFICGALPGEPRPSMILLPGNHVLPSRSEPRTRQQCLPMNETHPCHPYLDLHSTAMDAIADPLPTRLPHLDYCYRVYWAGGPTGCWTSLGISPSTNTLGL
ncbi:hypothetical protein K438DRAFT_1831169 [Mycena galopus ATCC 62051]|nr:hypothetical protein K438DRAFT_1831169 [Mycena galopus ATCC 62051]